MKYTSVNVKILDIAVLFQKININRERKSHFQTS